MANHSGDGTKWSPKDALNEAIESIDKNDGAFNQDLKKILIIAIEDSDVDNYNIGFIQSGLKMSECITACDIVKSKFRKYMGY